jgi:hypothetical protein
MYEIRFYIKNNKTNKKYGIHIPTIDLDKKSISKCFDVIKKELSYIINNAK